MKADLHVEFRSKTISVVNKGLRWFMPSLGTILFLNSMNLLKIIYIFLYCIYTHHR